MLDSAIKAQLKSYLERLSHPVELVASFGTGSKADETRRLLADILDCSPQVSLREDSHPMQPSFGVSVPGTEPRIRFAGLPMGHELSIGVLRRGPPEQLR